MKIRIGVGASGAASTPEALAELVAAVEALGFDSLWLSEVLTGPVLDPMVGLAWAAASHPRLKLGTTMLLPGRNVLRLAKQLASLDVLCRGRLLVTMVPGLTYAPERDAIGVDPKRRGALIDEALPLLRRLWAGETVSHDGAAGSFRDVKLSPLPVQQPLEVWLGGTVPAALERCGRLSDGWLPSLCTPEEAAAGRIVIDDAAARAGRSISSEHFGMSIGYARTPIDAATARVMTARRPRSVELTPVVVAAACMALASTCFILSLAHTSVANTLLLMSTGPYVTALLGWLLLRERVAPRTWLTMGVALAGAVVMVSSSYGRGAMVGDLLAVVMATSFAVATVVVRRHPDIQMAPAAALATALTALVALPLATPLETAPRDLALLAFFGVGQFGAGFLLFMAGARLIPAAESSLIGMLETVLGPLWVWLVLSERPGAASLAGGALILAAHQANTVVDLLASGE